MYELQTFWSPFLCSLRVTCYSALLGRVGNNRRTGHPKWEILSLLRGTVSGTRGWTESSCECKRVSLVLQDITFNVTIRRKTLFYTGKKTSFQKVLKRRAASYANKAVRSAICCSQSYHTLRSHLLPNRLGFLPPERQRGKSRIPCEHQFTERIRWKTNFCRWLYVSPFFCHWLCSSSFWQRWVSWQVDLY